MRKYALFLFVFALAASCKKDDDNGSSLTKENLAGSYTLTSAKASFLGSEVDLTTNTILTPAIITACQKDDVITLKTDNTFTLQDAGQTCSPNGSTNGAWSLSGNAITITGLSFVPGTSSISGTINSFDGRMLQIRDTVDITGFQLPLTLVPISLVFTKQ